MELWRMENIVNVSDESVLVLLQVIMSRFKSSNMNSILLSYLICILSFNPKATIKLCKAVLKFSTDTLYLERTQQLNMAMVIEMVLVHQTVINTIVHRNNLDVEEEAQDYVDSEQSPVQHVLGTGALAVTKRGGEFLLNQELQFFDLVQCLQVHLPSNQALLGTTHHSSHQVHLRKERSRSCVRLSGRLMRVELGRSLRNAQGPMAKNVLLGKS